MSHPTTATSTPSSMITRAVCVMAPTSCWYIASSAVGDRSRSPATMPMAMLPIDRPAVSVAAPIARPRPVPRIAVLRRRASRMPSPNRASVMTGNHHPIAATIAYPVRIAARVSPSPMITTLSTVGMSSAAPRPRSTRFCLTRSTTAPSWMPTPSGVSTTRPPPSDVAAVVSARWAARVAVAQTSAKASDSTTRVTVWVTRLSRPSAAGACSRSSAWTARGGSPSPAMPSKTFAVIWLKSTSAVMADMVSSTISACTAGSSTRGARVLTNASSSTSCTRAHALTIETGTRIAAMTMQIADTTARQRPLARRAGTAVSSSKTSVCARRFSFSVRSASICACRSSAAVSDMWPPRRG